MKNKLIVLAAGLAIWNSCNEAMSADRREEVVVNGVRVMKGFTPTTVEKAHKAPDITIQQKQEAYDPKRRLYYFPKDDSSPAQKFPKPSVRESGESLIYSLSDGGYLKTMFVSGAIAEVSPLHYVAPWGGLGLLGGGIIGSKLGYEQRGVLTAAALGALGGGFLGEIIRRNTGTPLRSTESVLGSVDRRIRVAESDVTNMPWRVHGRLQMSFSCGDYIGSGTSTGPEDVLTAAHNLYDSDKEEEVGAVSFYPGSYGTNVPWAAEGVSWTIHPRYKAPRMPFERKLYDMAVIKLSDTLGMKTGYLGYSELDSMEGNITVTGYPGSPGNGKFMYTMDGPLITASAERVFYDIDTSPGNSGGSVTKQFPDIGHLSVAIHAYGVDPDDTEEAGKRYNSGTLITKEKYDLIKAWTS